MCSHDATVKLGIPSLWLGFGRGGVGTGGVGTGGIGAGGVGTGGRGAGGLGTRGMDPPPGGGAGGVGYDGKTPTLASALPRVWVRAALVKASVHGEKVASGDCIREPEDHCAKPLRMRSTKSRRRHSNRNKPCRHGGLRRSCWPAIARGAKHRESKRPI
jgi:hypothetical protein